MTPSLEALSLPAPSRIAGLPERTIRRAKAHGCDRLDSDWFNNLPLGQDRPFQAQRFGCRGWIEDRLGHGIRLIRSLWVGPHRLEAGARLACCSLRPQASRFLLHVPVEPYL